MNFIILATVIGVAFATSNKISPSLISSLESKHTANIMVSFVGGNTEVVNAIETRSYKTRTHRLNSLTTSLQRHAHKSQKNVLSFLKSKFINYQSFWISNQISITGADEHLVKVIAAFPEVEIVEEERIIPLEIPVSKLSAKKVDPTPLAEWGISMIQAPEAWAITNGSGVVIATIDTGVRYTHEAIRDNYRAEYGWLDPYASSPAPNDQNGHGTHTMGTIVGSKGIGVAPGAQWIVCKGCSVSCSQTALTRCGEWALCPTKPDGSDPDCSKAPVLVSNSWGGSRGSNWYEPVTEAWIAGGILPLFSIGNEGPYCGSTSSPGDMRRVIGVGSTNYRDEISRFSSLGPDTAGRIKPEISAPGEDVRSAIPDSDDSYGTKSGTSMACPHAAGVAALLLSVHPDLTFAQARKALVQGVDISVTSQNQTCDGIPDTRFPNFHFGYGRINALKIVQSAKAALKY